MRPAYFAVFALLLAALVSPARAQTLPTGLRLSPAGRQIPLPGTLALGVCRVPGTPYAIVNCGGGLQSLTVIDTHSGRAVSSALFQTELTPPVKGQAFQITGSAWYGVAAHGRTVYAAGGGTDLIHVYTLSDAGRLVPDGFFSEKNSDPKRVQFPAGLATNADGTRLFAANNLGDTLSVWDTKTRKLLGSVPVGAYPLAVTCGGNDGLVYVTSERAGGVSIVDTSQMRRVAFIRTGSHPDAVCLSPDDGTLFVANAGSDTVSVVSTATQKVVDTLLLRPASARGLPGVSPTGLALSADGRTLYVTLGDLNAVAVVAWEERPPRPPKFGGQRPVASSCRKAAGNTLRSSTRPTAKVAPPRIGGPGGPSSEIGGASVGLLSLRGLLPTGWYPAAVCVAGDGRHLCVVNAKGSAARVPNSSGPQDTRGGVLSRSVNYLLRGTVSFVPVPDSKSLLRGTRTVIRSAAGAGANPADRDAARRIAALPVRHVLYIIKENRTYDQVLGDLAGASGDPALALFGRPVTPNIHALARRFCTLDNFFCCAEVSADGWNWSVSGFANDYVQRTVAESYGERKNSPRPQVRPYDYEGENRGKSPALVGETDVAASTGGTLWENAVRHGLTVRNYGCFLAFKDAAPTQPSLVNRTCPDFAPYAMNHADSDAWVRLGLPAPGQFLPAKGAKKTDPPPVNLTYYHGQPSRFSAWNAEFDRYERDNDLPALSVIRLPRDHTAGTTFPLDTPAACVADNDYAVGEIVQAVSHSRFWRSTAIFVVEDDAQSGPDHVDCHRSVCLVASPFVRHGTVDSRFFNTDSVLRTMELLLHLPPMTRLDAGARPLDVFGPAPDLTPYTALVPDRSLLSGKNLKTAYGAKESAGMNFREADAVPDAALNRILWRNAKGKNAALPAVRGGE